MEFAAPKVAERAMILNTIAEKLKRQSKDDFKGLVANNFDVEQISQMQSAGVRTINIFGIPAA